MQQRLEFARVLAARVAGRGLRIKAAYNQPGCKGHCLQCTRCDHTGTGATQVGATYLQPAWPAARFLLLNARVRGRKIRGRCISPISQKKGR